MYNHKQIEEKWNKKWEDSGIYKTKNDKNKEKYYILDMFPYPSGAGLHVGHPKGYIATDIFARFKTMQNFNVLHPMGWDAFGLPAENFALKSKTHPKIQTKKNIEMYRSQLDKLGFSYDWDREINTTDPEFYKWTQWIFLKMFERGLAFESNEPVNWCPSCKTVLANEDLENGRCERCDSEVEQRPIRQWVLRITDYADRLLEDLDKLPDWDESIKEMQKNWIGRSFGARVKFQIIANSSTQLELNFLEVFTTRPDTLFGCTYMVVSPEHSILKEQKEKIKNLKEIEEYQKKARKKTELERTDLAKEKTGVKIDGLLAINPVNNEKIPIYVADYVLASYGTGAIMAVPAHDERDFEFAEKYNIDIKQVVKDKNKKIDNNEIFIDNGICINSEFLNGLETTEAKKKIIKWLKEHKVGEEAVNYKLKDWVFSRQRYWGEPIPIIHCQKCGAVGVPEEELPLKLPEVEFYEPTGTDESPLAGIENWVNTTCPKCGAPARRETNTMPQWAGSSWYYLRFIDPKNNNELVNKEKEKYWSPVDFYVGGAEHATRHLIYARFWHKFLYDIGVVNYEEPFKRLQHVGLVMAEDGRKMSKRWGNVINPDDVIEEFGADALRLYEMFMSPFSQSCSWSNKGLIGTRRFLEKVYKLSNNLSDNINVQATEKILHKTIKKVTEDINDFKFNTAISQLMILVNKMVENNVNKTSNFEILLKLLAPFTPYSSEELWSRLGYTTSIFEESWPIFNNALVIDDEFEMIVQVNGKVRDKMVVSSDKKQEEIEKIVLKNEKVKKWTKNKKIVKIIFVPGRLINLVVL